MFNGRDQNPQGAANPNPAAQQNNTDAERIRVENVLRYMNQVEQQLEDDPQTYIEFLDLMRDYESHQLDTDSVIRRVSQLLNEFPRLVMGFNAILPPGFNIQIVPNEMIVVDAENMIQFVSPVQPYIGHGDGEDEMEDDDGYEEEQGVEDEEAEEQRLGGEEMDRDGGVQDDPEEGGEDEEIGIEENSHY